MPLRAFRVPQWIQWLYPGALFSVSGCDRVLFLTFDDGPTPELLPWILEQLTRFEAQATFFCVGENVMRYPELFSAVIENGHRPGNHTHHHLSAAQTAKVHYLHDIRKAEHYIGRKLFRPPYGRLSPSQTQRLQKLGYQVVFWSLLSYDFDPRLHASFILEQLKRKVRNGDIIVFHDNPKAAPHLYKVLPSFLAHCRQQGFRFAVL